MKKVLALLLVLALLVGILPAAFAEESQPEQTDAVLTAQEVEGASRLEERNVQKAEETAQPSYAEDETVTVIVHLEEPALMDYFGVSPFAAASETLSAGEAVSAFLTSKDAQDMSDELLAEQDAILDKIARQPSVDGLEVVGQWTALVNAVAVKVPYGALSEIQEIPGVRSAYVEITYDRPDEPVTEAGTAGYSYDLVGIDAVWSEGFTGEGMLVAILDTGLDLEWSTYWDNDAGGNITGIRRVHEAFTENSFKTEDGKSNIRWTESAMDRFVQTTQLAANTGRDGNLIVYEHNDLYKNRKVPFAADYADGDLNVRPTDSDHGTHVAGTVAGYAESEEGEVLFSGVAPDAQILALKVFPDDSASGAGESAILNALNDAALLGADVVNLSLGSDNGFAKDDSAANAAYHSLYASGILFMTSAGNAGYSSVNSSYGDYGLASNPEISMMSSPAVYDSNLAVASYNNSVDSVSTLVWTDTDGTEHEIPFSDPNTVAMKYKFAGVEDLSVNIIPVGGTGTYNDYYNAGFRSYYGYGEQGVSGIALVQRGELSFADKINNASQFTWSYYNPALGYYVTESPVKAVLIYDSDPESSELIGMSVDGTTLTSASLSGADGAALYAAATEAIANGSYVTLTEVKKEDTVITASAAEEMSSFSSWGAGPSLELKPEITAPGGNIWSSILDTTYQGGSGTYSDYTGSYGMMSGTSMAAPHMTGITALVKQYVMDQLGVSVKDAAGLTQQLLVSTALPQKDAGGAYYSPRLQGAGLVSASGAVSTPAYITVDGQNVGKLELKDDPTKSGSYDLTFQVHNLTNAALTYTAKAVLLRPDTTTVDGSLLMTDSDVVIKTVSLGTVTVPAGGSAAVNQTVTLTADEMAELDRLFVNGTYVEGFVILTDAAGENPQIGLPFLAFYGDWTKAPIFDSATWLDIVEADEDLDGRTEKSFLDGEFTWWPSVMGYADGYNYYNLGQNIFDEHSMEEQTVFYEENITISPDGWFKSINDYELYQLREAKVVVVEVKDKETGELYYRDYAGYQFKTYYDSSYALPIPASLYYFTGTDWAGTDLEGNVLPSGTQCIYTITAYGDGDYPTDEDGYTDFEAIIPGENEPTFNGHSMDLTGDVISFDVMVDTEAPTLVNNAVSIYEAEAEDGTMHTYLTGTFTDEGSIASIEVAPVVTRTYKEGYGDSNYSETKVNLSDAFYTEYIYDKDVDEYTFIADVTNYVHNDSYSGESYYYDFTWTGAVYVYGGDYGGNDRAYAIAVEGNTGEGLILSQTSALLHVGSEFDLSVIDNTGSNAPITRTSTNPEVATIDEYGHVVALTPGQTTIIVTNGTSTAICIVAVEEYSTEVLDFDLSIDHFSGLKPGGEVIVKVVNLQPADVVLHEINWSISETDETAEYYEGLINVAQYTTDGLQGEVYLNYSATNDPNVQLPGGAAVLTVTLNGVSRTMEIDWEDLYTYSTDEDLVSDAFGGEQTVYVTQGETATLIAKYNNTSAHDVIPVQLYTLEGASQYGYTNPTTEAKGLVLEGVPAVGSGAEWRGKLVALPGYELPAYIQVGTRYDYGYEYWWENSTYYTYYTYDSQTGEIWVKNGPYGATNTMVIRADGVENPDAPGGTRSDVTYETPDALYGPFDWAATEGYTLTGGLTTAEGVTISYNTKNVAYYTPSEPGVSYITATTKDGQYSVNFAVICVGVKAASLDLDTHNVELMEGETQQLTATLSPEPTLDTDKELIWTSFNPEVATVDENGVITAVSEGYAFLKVSVATDTTVTSYCLVHVTPAPEPEKYTVTFQLMDGTGDVWSQTVVEGETAVRPDDPTREGYTFEGWFTGADYSEVYDFTAPVTADITLYAKWTENDVPVVTYTVTFNSMGGTPVERQTVEAGRTAAKPADPTHEGYTFEGWFTDADYSEAYDFTAPVTADITLYAKWTENDVPVVTYTVTFNSMGGTPVERQTVEAGRTAAKPADPTREGYTFEGWFTGADYSEAYDFAAPVTADITLYAKWSKNVVVPPTPGKPSTPSPAAPAEPEIPFTDVSESASYYDAVKYVYENDLMNGTSATKFAPGSTLTRGMVVTILHRMEGLPAVSYAGTFPDVAAGVWYTDGVEWAAENSIVTGYTTGKFGPEDPVTREQLAAILYRYAEYKGYDVSKTADLSGYTDGGNVSEYAKTNVAWAVANGILESANGKLRPREDATRAEVAVAVAAFHQQYVK